MNIDWTIAGQVVFSGLIVVFVALIALVFVIWLLGKILGAARSEKPQAPSAPVQASVQPKPAPAVPVVEAGIEEETVAVITAAALSAMEQAGIPAKNCVVKSVRRSRVTRPIWSFEGMQQNTRPF